MSRFLTAADFEALKIPQLKAMAKQAELPFTSKIKRADLIDLIVKSPKGRKEFFQLEHEAFAAEFVAKMQTQGSGSLAKPPRPEPATSVVLPGNHNSFADMASHANKMDEDKKAAFVVWITYVERVKAIKALIRGDKTGVKIYGYEWGENETCFSVAKKATTAAA